MGMIPEGYSLIWPIRGYANGQGMVFVISAPIRVYISSQIFDDVIAQWTFCVVAIRKTKSATIAFFSSPPFFLLALSFSPFLFFRYYDFGASQA